LLDESSVGMAPLVVRETFAAPEQEAVMVTLVIFDWFLALQLGSLLYNRLAQQQDRLDFFGIGHVKGEILRASLRIAL
jgi:hypothetical protein